MPNPTTRLCRYCNAPLAGQKTVQCGAAECARTHKLETQRAYHQRYRDKHGVGYNDRRRQDPVKLESDRAYHRDRVTSPCAACAAPVPRRRASQREHHRPRCDNSFCRSWIFTGRWPQTPVPDLHPSRSTKIPKGHPALRSTYIPRQRTGPRFVTGRCRFCQGWFTVDRAVVLGSTSEHWYCTHRCGKKAAKARRRANLATAKRETVSPVVVFTRDRWRCQVCKRKVKRDAVVPHDLAPTLDHVVPVIQDGDHTYANTWTAHFICNSRRGDRGGGEQLALIR